MEQDLRFWLDQALLFADHEAKAHVLAHPELEQTSECDPAMARQISLVKLLSANDSQKVIDAVTHSHDRRERVINTISLARALYGSGHVQEAIEVLDAEINGEHELELIEQLALFFRRGRYRMYAREYSESLQDLIVASSHAETLGNAPVLAEILNDLATIASSSGDLVKAIAYLEQSLLYLKSSSAHQSKLVRFRINLASQYVSAGQLENALAEYLQLSTDDLVLDDPEYALVTFLNMAITYKRLGRNEESAQTYHRVLEIAHEWNNTEFEIRALIGITDHYVIVDDLDQAKHYIMEAMDCVERNNVQSLEDVVNIHYANVDRSLGELDAAIERLRTYYDRFNKVHNVRDTVLYGSDLAEWLAEAGRYNEAFDVLKNCSSLQRSVYDQEIERTMQLSALRSKLDLEQESIRRRDEARTAILNSVLSAHIAQRLMAGEQKIGERVASVSILFADIVGFTQLAASMEPEELVDLLEDLFSKMDAISEKFGCERIKTIGDSYMAACGLAGDHDDHTERLCRTALAIVDEASTLPLTPSQFRLGIHSGPVVAGVMSGSRLSYDIWGDTVNVASRMEKNSTPGSVLCSSDAAARIVHIPDFVLKEREPLDIRGKGLMTTFWLTAR